MTRTSWLRAGIRTFLFFGLLTANVFGQGTTAVISGIVRDTSEAVIAGATITATNTDTGATRTAQSDAQGRYRVGELPPATYQVAVTMAGFSTETHRGIGLQVGQEQALNFTMQVGAVEQQVDVTGVAPLVETSTTSVSNNVTSEQLRELPLNGRSFTDLVQLQPGAIAPANQVTTAAGAVSVGNGPQLSVSGARTDANTYMIDGTDVNPTSNGTPGSAGRVQLGVDTIREYQVITSNAKAEYGRNAGGIINAVSRSGTNDLHGSLFEFLRNSALDARNFFADVNPPFRQNQFGTTAGGPLKKDKTFFFLGYEGLRSRLTATTVYNVPTLLAKQGKEGIGLLTGAQTVDPRVVPYLNLYPLPNGANAAGSNGVANFFDSQNQPVGENYGSARIDHSLSTNDSFFGRYTIDRSAKTAVNTLLSNFSLETHNQYLTFQEDHIFSPTLLNMFRAGYNRSFNAALPLDVPNGLALSFGAGRPMGSLNPGSTLAIIGPNQISYNVYQVQNAFQVDEQLSYTRGAHSMKFGAGFERFQWNSDQPNNLTGAYVFNSFASFLQAGPTGTSGTTSQPGSITSRHLRTTLPAFFVEDDYRLTPRLTLNLGFRWEFTTGFTETNGYLSYLAKGPYLSTIDDLKTGSGWKNHPWNLEPRFGFNYGVDASGKTALSGGFGIYHSEILHNNMIAERFQLPFIVRGSFANADVRQTFPNIYAGVAAFGTGNFSNTESRHFDYYNFKSPTFYRYNLTLQRELPGSIALRIGYVGATGFHNGRNMILNRFPVPVKQADGRLFFPCGAVLPNGGPPTPTCPNPVPQFINSTFGNLPFFVSDSNSVYSAFVANIQKRFSKGLIFQLSYTWSKSVDDISATESNFNSEVRNGQFAWDRHMDRAQSTFNVPHVLVFNALYELPVGQGRHWMNTGGVANVLFGGWQVGGILTMQSGTPFTVNCGSCTFTGFQFVATRPDLKPGVDTGKITTIPTNVKGSGKASQYFDPTAFSQPTAGFAGNSGRDNLLGPGLKNVNFTLSKTFNATERMKLQFRSEFFNLFNHTNFANPNQSVFSSTAGAYSPTAGQLIGTSVPARQIQFGLKLTF